MDVVDDQFAGKIATRRDCQTPIVLLNPTDITAHFPLLIESLIAAR